MAAKVMIRPAMWVLRRGVLVALASPRQCCLIFSDARASEPIGARRAYSLEFRSLFVERDLPT
jgi:hypothetical protein